MICCVDWSDRFNVDDVEVEEEIRPDFPCPYCYEDFDIASLCSHLEDEHSCESKAAVSFFTCICIGQVKIGCKKVWLFCSFLWNGWFQVWWWKKIFQLSSLVLTKIQVSIFGYMIGGMFLFLVILVFVLFFGCVRDCVHLQVVECSSLVIYGRCGFRSRVRGRVN